MTHTTIVIPCKCCGRLIEQRPDADFCRSLAVDRCFDCRMWCQPNARYGCCLKPTPERQL